MRQSYKILLLGVLLIALCIIFLGYKPGNNWEYALEKRSIKIAAMLIVSCCVAYSSIVFQTLTQNKILTPAVMGFEAVYLLFQTIMVFCYGDKTFKVLNNSQNFMISVLCMMSFSIVLYYLVFRKDKNNMYFLLLIGLVLGTVFGTLSSFMQLLTDPNEFLLIEGKMFATFNKMNTGLLWIAFAVTAVAVTAGIQKMKYLDVMALGREQAVNLGVDYPGNTRFFLLIISILTAVSTALVGPVTFLGILVSNLTYELFKTYRHSVLIAACRLLSSIAVVGGQFLIEHVFNFSTAISIIINFIGGIYFLYLLLNAKKL